MAMKRRTLIRRVTSRRSPFALQPPFFWRIARRIVKPTDQSLSRRDFVAATSLGAVALWRGTALAQVLPSRAADPLMYVGSYTENGRRDGIFLVRMNSATGALQQVGAVDGGPNPSYLTIHPNGRMLYAVNETTETQGKASGAVSSYSIDPESGALTFFNEQLSQGGAPCYVSTDRKGRVALVANYVSGTLAILPLANDGGLEAAPQVVQHVGTGPVTSRQESAHAHCVIPHPNNRFVFAADLGADRVLVYRYDEQANSLQHVERSDAAMPAGAGPRHLVFHPTMPFVFVANGVDASGAVVGEQLPGGHPCLAGRPLSLRLQSWPQQHRGVLDRPTDRGARTDPGGLHGRRLAAQLHTRSHRAMVARGESAVRLGSRVLAQFDERSTDGVVAAHRVAESLVPPLPIGDLAANH
jgi:hypothetical protein